MEIEQNIRRETVRVLLRITLFLVFYIALIAVGIGIFWGAYELTSFILLSESIEWTKHIRANVMLVLALLGIWALAFSLGFYLVKPLFSFTRYKREGSLEITREEASELFVLIDELTQQVGCEKPKHVYLTPDVNAAVFFDTSFWSIFFPVRKNLEIGLGLCPSMSQEELRAVLAHEFGHFSQKTMRVRASVNVVNTVLGNLVNTEDFYDRWLHTWCNSRIYILALFGKLTRALTQGIKRLNVSMYRWVQKAHLGLSRQMEYDADTIACRAVGTENMVSALCKLPILVSRQALYERFVVNSQREGKYIDADAYWQGYAAIEPELERAGDILAHISYKERMTKPAESCSEWPSRLEIKDIWRSHPSLEERIAHAKEVSAPNESNRLSDPAWTLFPEKACEAVGHYRMDCIARLKEEEKEKVGLDDFKAWVTSEVDTYFLPQALRPFYSNITLRFPISNEPQGDAAYPFTPENRNALLEFETAWQDWQTLQRIATGDAEVKEFRYEGKRYTDKQVPFDAHRSYLEALLEKAKAINEAVYRYLWNHAENPSALKGAYESLFYIPDFQAEYAPLRDAFDQVADELDRLTQEEVEKDKQRYIDELQRCESALRQLIGHLRRDLLESIVQEAYLDQLADYARETHLSVLDINWKAAKEMWHIIEALEDIHNQLEATANQQIREELKRCFRNAGS